MQLMTYIVIAIKLFVVTGCCSPAINRTYTVFPTPPKEVQITKDPILQYRASDKTYLVTAEFVRRSVEQELYLRRVLTWKEVNQVD
jgi:hypothetical protein